MKRKRSVRRGRVGRSPIHLLQPQGRVFLLLFDGPEGTDAEGLELGRVGLRDLVEADFLQSDSRLEVGGVAEGVLEARFPAEALVGVHHSVEQAPSHMLLLEGDSPNVHHEAPLSQDRLDFLINGRKHLLFQANAGRNEV